MPSRVLRFRVTEVELVQLRRVATETGLPLSTMIRAAVADYVDDLTDGAEVYRVNTPCPTPRFRES